MSEGQPGSQRSFAPNKTGHRLAGSHILQAFLNGAERGENFNNLAKSM